MTVLIILLLVLLVVVWAFMSASKMPPDPMEGIFDKEPVPSKPFTQEDKDVVLNWLTEFYGVLPEEWKPSRKKLVGNKVVFVNQNTGDTIDITIYFKRWYGKKLGNLTDKTADEMLKPIDHLLRPLIWGFFKERTNEWRDVYIVRRRRMEKEVRVGYQFKEFDVAICYMMANAKIPIENMELDDGTANQES